MNDKKTKKSSKFKHVIFALAILALGIALFFILKNFRKPPQQSPQDVLPPLVDIISIDPCDVQMVISGFGTVKPQVQVDIVPQVTGNVIKINPQFKEGGFIPANDTIIKIDPRDYQLALRQAKAAVAQAKVQLDIELAEAKLAKDEWYQLNPNTEPNSPLVLRKPQIQQAQTNYQSALAKLETAQLNLDRTNISMPIDIIISNENIDLGQLAKAGSSIGSAYGTKKAEVVVPLDDDQLQWFNIPDSTNHNNSNKQKGSPALIYADFAGKKITWKGKITRTTGQVDIKSRLVNVVIEINKPFQAKNNQPLLPGTFVKVDILGKKLKNVYKIPRLAVRHPNQIWLANEEKLTITDLNSLRADENFVYTQQNLNTQTLMVITTPLDAVVDQMKIRYNNNKNISDPNQPNLPEVQK